MWQQRLFAKCYKCWYLHKLVVTTCFSNCGVFWLSRLCEGLSLSQRFACKQCYFEISWWSFGISFIFRRFYLQSCRGIRFRTPVADGDWMSLFLRICRGHNKSYCWLCPVYVIQRFQTISVLPSRHACSSCSASFDSPSALAYAAEFV